MNVSKTGRARKARRKMAKKTGLVALAAAALASPVATTPVIAQSPSSVSPQPSRESVTYTEFDRPMGSVSVPKDPATIFSQPAPPTKDDATIFSQPAPGTPPAKN